MQYHAHEVLELLGNIVLRVELPTLLRGRSAQGQCNLPDHLGSQAAKSFRAARHVGSGPRPNGDLP